jgi:hypothetical protein
MIDHAPAADRARVARRGGLMLVLLVLLFWLPMFRPGLVFDNADDVFVHLFFQAFIDQAVTVDHTLPLWTHHLGGGFPLSVDPDFPFPDLFAIAATVLDPLTGLKAVMLLWLLLGAGAVYWIARRELATSAPVAVGTALAVVCSSWSVRRLVIGGDVNDVAAFSFLIFYAVYRYLSRRPLADEGGVRRGVALAFSPRRAAWPLALASLLIGTALASGKMHLFVLGVMGVVVAVADAAPWAWRRDARAVLPPVVAGVILALPLVLFRARLWATFGFAKALSGSVDFGYKTGRVDDFGAGPLVDKVLATHLQPWWLGVAVALLALGFVVRQRRHAALLVVAIVAALLMLGHDTPVGRAFFSLPIARTTGSFKYYSFYLFAPLVLLAGGAVDRLARGRRWVLAVAGAALAIWCGLAGALLVTHVSQPLAPVARQAAFFHTSSRGTPPNPYYALAGNFGLLEWGSPFGLPVGAEAQLILDETDHGAAPRFRRVLGNPAYRGEAYFARATNRVAAVRRATNRIAVEVDVQEAPGLLRVNETFDAGWRSDVGHAVGQGNSLHVAALPAGRYTVELAYRPMGYVVRAAADLAVMVALLLFVIVGAVRGLIRPA